MKRLIYLLPLMLIFFAACEEDFDIELPDPEQKLVVEGIIENNGFPLVLITRSANYYSALDLDNLEGLMVSGADVTVSDGTREVQLQEIRIDTANGFELVVYVSPDMVGEEGKTYTLTVKKDGEILTAQTTIPVAVPVDSIYAEPAGSTDSFMQLNGHLTDPAGEANYYRYAARRNSGPFLYPSNSVTDDVFFDGQSLPFPISRPFDENEEDLPYGLYRQGDTVTVKFCSISQQTFNFYRSTEYQRQSTGNPFSNITRIQSNVVGGLGIWAGYGCRNYTIVLE